MGREEALVFAGDERVAIGLAVAARSMAETLSPAAHPSVYVLSVGVSEQSRRKIQRAVTAIRPDLTPQWVSVPDARLLTPRRPDLTPASFARLLIPELLPSSVRRVVYLDADVLVRRDLSPLLCMSLGGARIGAVRNFREQPAPYFNTGVLVMDIARWRAEGIAESALNVARADPSISDDEHALNKVVSTWTEIGERWNVQVGSLFFEGFRGLVPRPDHGAFTDGLVARRWQLYRDGAILHFVGVKPWRRGVCPLPGTTAWTVMLLRTGWLTPQDATRWVVRYVAARGRYALGTMRLIARKRARRDARTQAA